MYSHTSHSVGDLSRSTGLNGGPVNTRTRTAVYSIGPSHLQHVCHEGLRRSRARSVDDKRNHCGEGRRKGFSDDGAGGRPGEDLNLTGRVRHDERRLWFSLLFAQLDDLDTDRSSLRILVQAVVWEFTVNALLDSGVN